MNKKGLGALAATGILIVFSIGLGLLFMEWGKSYIEQRAEFVVGVSSGKAGCTDLNLRFIEINRLPQICHSENTLNFLVENVGNTPVVQFQARVVDGEGVKTIDDAISSPILIGESRSIEIPVQPPAKQAKVTPVIVREGGKKEFCFDKSLELDGPYAAC